MKKLLVVMSLLWSVSLWAQEVQPYKIYDKDLLSKEFHKGRREQLAKKLKSKSIAVFFASDERLRSNDTYFQYKSDNNLTYLTGMTEPGSALVLVPDGIQFSSDSKTCFSILFVPKRDYRYEVYNGRRLGVEGAMQILGMDTAFTNDEFGERFVKILQTQNTAGKLENIYSPLLKEQVESRALRTMIQAFTDFRNEPRRALGYLTAVSFSEADRPVYELRSIKTDDEINLLKKTIEISCDGHLQMMKSAEPNMFEYELRAIGEYTFAREGSEYVGYGSICGSAENSTILHYITTRRQCKDGDVVLIDMAAEYHGYSADVTRTFPVNGKFSKEQAAIYQIVYKAQQTGIDAIKPGAKYQEITDMITKVLEDGLMELGLIKDRQDAKRYTIHGYMHSIGLDVHDPQGFATDFTPGYFTTVEPGIYIPEGSPVDKKWWNIGVRIEDDILVTKEGCVNMSAKAPRTIDEIEKVMKKKGIGNLPVDHEK